MPTKANVLIIMSIQTVIIGSLIPNALPFSWHKLDEEQVGLDKSNPLARFSHFDYLQ
jgi:hypothetical protein